jgi:methylenetetrahydrofolate reductase (NADPH)
VELKAKYATHVVTQLCFDAGTTTAWARKLKQRGVELPIYAGIPGAVSRQKLIRISAGLGLGQSARFLKKQQNMLWRFFLPGGYSPNKLFEGLAPRIAEAETNLAGFHLFTFNELEKTEAWRRRLQARLGNSS